MVTSVTLCRVCIIPLISGQRRTRIITEHKAPLALKATLNLVWPPIRHLLCTSDLRQDANARYSQWHHKLAMEGQDDAYLSEQKRLTEATAVD